MGPLLAVAFLASALPNIADAKALVTFDVDVQAFCPAGVQPNGIWTCDSGAQATCPEEATLKAMAQQDLAWVSRIWEVTGVSLRLHSASVVAGDPATAEGDDAKSQPLFAEAAKDGSRIKLYVLPCLKTCFAPCVPSPGVPNGGCAPKERGFGFFCNTSYAPVVAHELSHYFCMAHPFTQRDRSEESLALGATVSHDGDGITDTPPDPCGPEVVETKETDMAKKRNADIVLKPGSVWSDDKAPNLDPAQIDATNDGHEWCYWDRLDVDPGSPLVNLFHGQKGHCVPKCYSQEDGATTETNYRPNPNLITSYFFYSCPGPNVVNGERFEPFSPQQLERLRNCWQQTDIRKDLVPVCDGHGGDSDSDGLCDDQDNCPNIWQEKQSDSDGDGLGDACDKCPFITSAANTDTDGDGLGDECDPDDDNDGCRDAQDKDPTSDQETVGTEMLGGECGDNKTAPWTQFAGIDTDGDGSLDCDTAEKDIDGDGILDDVDVCPTIAGSNTKCIRYKPCLPSLKKTCSGPGCLLDVFMRIKRFADPDPLNWINIDRFQVLGNRLYLSARPGEDLAALVGRGIRGPLESIGAQEASIAISLVNRNTGAETVLAQFDARLAPVRALRSGNTVEMVIPPSALFSMASAWGMGVPAEVKAIDSDNDSVPDLADNCIQVPNRLQRDTDQDGFGDACDADVDQDGMVTQLDVDRVQRCAGVPLLPRYVTRVPGEDPMADEGVAESARRMDCRVSDLNDDGQVGAQDVAIAKQWIGKRPGDSPPVASPEPVASPNPGGGPDGCNAPGRTASAGCAPVPRSRTVFWLLLAVIVGLILARRRARG